MGGMAGFRFIREDGAVPVDHRQLAEVSSYEPEPVEGPAPAVPYPDFAGQPGWQGEFWEYLENLPEKILMEIVLARRIAHGHVVARNPVQARRRLFSKRLLFCSHFIL